VTHRCRGAIFLKLLLLFVVVPLVELVLLIWLAHVTSVMFTIALVIISGFVGASMAKHQGMVVWLQAQKELQMGRFPADSLIDGLIILIGGALLITPGVLTDLVGFSTLFPPLRAIYRQSLKSGFKGKIHVMTPGVGGFGGFSQQSPGEPPKREEPSIQQEPSHRNEENTSPFNDDSPYNR
jgi:UPF0716 protein FxsA